jgi:CRP-like cAMP-binding protein
MDTYNGLTIGELFEGLPPETLREFRALGHRSFYPPDTTLFAFGEACVGVFWVISGDVRVSIFDLAGRCIMSRVAHAGEILGLRAALCGEAYGITARAEGHSEVGFVNRDDFSRFLSNQPEVTFRIVERLSDRLGFALDLLRSSSTASHPKRPN